MKYSGKKSVAYSGVVETSQVADYLEGIVEGLRAGVVTLENDGEVVSLQPGETIEMTVEGKRKGDDEKLSIELRWRPAQSLEAPSLKISGEAAEEEELEEDDEEEEDAEDESEDEEDDEEEEENEDDESDRKEAEKDRRRAAAEVKEKAAEKAKKKKKK